MIKRVNDVPNKAKKRGKRINEISTFVNSGAKFGKYALEQDEDVNNVYHSFKNAVVKMKLTDVVNITIRCREIYFIRRDA